MKDILILAFNPEYVDTKVIDELQTTLNIAGIALVTVVHLDRSALPVYEISFIEFLKWKQKDKYENKD